MNTQSPQHNHFVELLTRISAQLINVDGKVETVEIQTFKNFFQTKLNFSNSALLWVEDLLRSELKKEHSLEELSQEINNQFSSELKLVMLELLYQIAHSDFEFHAKEEEFLNKVVKLLGISSEDQQTVYNRHSGTSSASSSGNGQYYKVLGLAEGASQEEIKKAYRELVKKFHPDVVAHLGEEFRRLSEAKMKEITQAYEKLKV